MITTIIDFLANIVIKTIEVSGNFGVFLLMALESCGIPMPSEVIMPFAGYWVALGRLNFWVVVAVGTFGNLTGSLLAYWIAWKGGRPLIEKWGKYILISKHDLDLADKWFAKYGSATVFFGRLLPVVRTYISFPAGIAKMDIKKFAFYTFLGALPWTALFAWLGIKMGENWELVRKTLHNFDMTIAAGVVILVALYVWRHLKNKGR
ncbi:MAG: DedA family protein [Candidatus Berkelbacteria bacterium]